MPNNCELFGQPRSSPQNYEFHTCSSKTRVGLFWISNPDRQSQKRTLASASIQWGRWQIGYDRTLLGLEPYCGVAKSTIRTSMDCERISKLVGKLPRIETGNAVQSEKIAKTRKQPFKPRLKNNIDSLLLLTGRFKRHYRINCHMCTIGLARKCNIQILSRRRNCIAPTVPSVNLKNNMSVYFKNKFK